jgi:chaperonin cofactor prefoldin
MSASEYQQLIALLGERFETINRRFDTVDHRFEAIDRRFDEVRGETIVAVLSARIEDIERRLRSS